MILPQAKSPPNSKQQQACLPFTFLFRMAKAMRAMRKGMKKAAAAPAPKAMRRAMKAK